MSDRSDDDFRLPPGLLAIRAELATRQWESLAEAEAYLARRMAEFNRTPQAELGGLSPNEVQELLAGGWETTGPLRLNHGLTLESLAGAPFVLAARALLAAAADRNGVKATQAGNLVRKTVAELLDGAPWPGGELELVRTYKKVINEQNYWPLHVVRVVAQLGKLLRRRSGAFRTTPRGRELMAEAQAGALAAHLFRTFFRRFNLAYLSRWGDDRYEPHQPLVPLYLLRLAVLDDRWRRTHELVPLLDPLADLEREVAHEVSRYGALYEQSDEAALRERVLPFVFGMFRHRILRPLEWFGLLAGRERPGLIRLVPDRDWRKTALCDAFLVFPPAFRAAARRKLE